MWFQFNNNKKQNKKKPSFEQRSFNSGLTNPGLGILTQG
jgi:hypothetical protein